VTFRFLGCITVGAPAPHENKIMASNGSSITSRDQVPGRRGVTHFCGRTAPDQQATGAATAQGRQRLPWSRGAEYSGWSRTGCQHTNERHQRSSQPSCVEHTPPGSPVLLARPVAGAHGLERRLPFPGLNNGFDVGTAMLQLLGGSARLCNNRTLTRYKFHPLTPDPGSRQCCRLPSSASRRRIDIPGTAHHRRSSARAPIPYASCKSSGTKDTLRGSHASNRTPAWFVVNVQTAVLRQTKPPEFSCHSVCRAHDSTGGVLAGS